MWRPEGPIEMELRSEGLRAVALIAPPRNGGSGGMRSRWALCVVVQWSVHGTGTGGWGVLSYSICESVGA